MKKLLTMITLLVAFGAKAQDGIFLQPEFGAGTTNVNTNMIMVSNGWYWGDDKKSATFCYSAGLGVGYRIRHLVLNTGLYFLQSGYCDEYWGGDLVLTKTKRTQTYNHISLPVVASVQINLGRRFTLTPGLGVAATYNSSSKVSEQVNGQTYNYDISGASFDQENRRINVWSVARLQAGYRLSDRVSIVVGPEYQLMLNSIVSVGNSDYYQKNYTLNFMGGITWNCRARKGLTMKKFR